MLEHGEASDIQKLLDTEGPEAMVVPSSSFPRWHLCWAVRACNLCAGCRVSCLDGTHVWRNFTRWPGSDTSGTYNHLGVARAGRGVWRLQMLRLALIAGCWVLTFLGWQRDVGPFFELPVAALQPVFLPPEEDL